MTMLRMLNLGKYHLGQNDYRFDVVQIKFFRINIKLY